MLFILDNYDSFTYNLVQRFGEIDPRLHVHVARNDKRDRRLLPCSLRIVVSPGPAPHEAGISMELIRQLGPAPDPGCLSGTQSMAEVFDSPVVRAERLMHGKVSPIHHLGTSVLQDFRTVHGNALSQSAVPEATQPGTEVTAWADFPGHQNHGTASSTTSIHGVQFHPESFLTEGGIELLKNFLKIANLR